MKLSVFFHHVVCAAKEQDISLEEELKQIRRMGIEYVEVDREDAGRNETEIRELKALLDKCDLKVGCVYGTYDWERDLSARRSAQAVQEAGRQGLHLLQARLLEANNIMLIPGFYDTGSAFWGVLFRKKQLRNMLEGMRSMTEEAVRKGFTVLIEDFDNENSPISTIEGMRTFLDYIPELKVALDTGNLFFSGENVLEAQELFADKISFVHLKDRLVLSEEDRNRLTPSEESALGEKITGAGGREMYACALGEGCIPIPEVLERLKDNGYDGILAMEFFGASSYALAIRKSAEYVQSLL